jgi:hypothetical protein
MAYGIPENETLPTRDGKPCLTINSDKKSLLTESHTNDNITFQFLRNPLSSGKSDDKQQP